MVLLKSPFDGKNPSWKFRAPAQCASLRVPFPSLTKASNRVENLLEARGLGLQLFLRDYQERMGVFMTLPPSLCFFLCATFRQTQPKALTTAAAETTNHLNHSFISVYPQDQIPNSSSKEPPQCHCPGKSSPVKRCSVLNTCCSKRFRN